MEEETQAVIILALTLTQGKVPLQCCIGIEANMTAAFVPGVVGKLEVEVEVCGLGGLAHYE